MHCCLLEVESTQLRPTEDHSREGQLCIWCDKSLMIMSGKMDGTLFIS